MLERIVLVMFGAIVLIFGILPAILQLSDSAVPIQGKETVEQIALIARSSDQGAEWERVDIAENADLLFPQTVYDLAFHPEDPTIIFAGTQNGLWRSTSQGETWEKIEDQAEILLPNAQVVKIQIDPANPSFIYLAVFQNNRGRILKSIDGARSFREVFFTNKNGSRIADIVLHPGSSDILTISTSEGGVLNSFDQGKTWEVRKWFDAEVSDIIPNPNSANEFFVLLADDRLFFTPDNGLSWMDRSGPLLELKKSSSSRAVQLPPLFFSNPPKSPAFAQDFAFDKKTSSLYLASSQGVFSSQDGGLSWEAVNIIIPPKFLPINTVKVHPFDPFTIFVGAANQLYISKDGGISWKINSLPSPLRFGRILIHPKKPDILYIISGRSI